MRRFWFLLPSWWLVIFFAFPVLSHAQDAPDYSIRNIRYHFSPTLAEVFIEFDINNDGASASQPALAVARVLTSDQEVAKTSVAPISSLGLSPVALTFPTSLFSGQVVAFIVSVQLDEREAELSNTTQNNFAQIRVDFSSVPADAAPERQPGESVVTPAAPPTVTLGGLNLPSDAAVMILVGAAVLLLVMLLWVIIRLIFKRTPDFGHWQPPYLNLMPLDPNTSAGRRQQWQPHAQNHLLQPTGNAEGQTSVRKIAVRIDGKDGQAWQVGAARLCPFDAYGRVGRGVVLSGRGVRALNKAFGKSADWSAETLHKRLRGVSQEFVHGLKKRWTQQTMMLPLALDIGLQGKYGEAGMQFELSQWTNGRWQRLDSWQPDLPIVGKKWREQFTYTAYGQRSGETVKDFHNRLERDLTALLVQFASQRSEAISADNR